MSKKLPVYTDEVPHGIWKIVNNRMDPFVIFELRRAPITGSVDLQALAISAYLQGFSDCYEAMHKAEATKPSTESER